MASTSFWAESLVRPTRIWPFVSCEKISWIRSPATFTATDSSLSDLTLSAHVSRPVHVRLVVALGLVGFPVKLRQQFIAWSGPLVRESGVSGEIIKLIVEHADLWRFGCQRLH